MISLAVHPAVAIWREQTLHCQGDWTAANIASLENHWQKQPIAFDAIIVDGKGIEHLDTAGAWVLISYFRTLEAQDVKVQRQGFHERAEQLLSLIAQQSIATIPEPKKKHIVDILGKETINKITEVREFFDLVGRLAYSFVGAICHPKKLHVPSVVNIIELTGIRALGIAGLLAFLIGIVLAYQLGSQLQDYGAGIFVVYLSGTAIFREFGPLITAIIIAGRTSSAFTAQLGMMKVNQEIDAMLTMGLSPIDWLVLPRILGLLIIFPFLIFWADTLGVFGSMVMAKANLGIQFANFLTQFQHSVSVKSFWVGISKAPVFALIIATVGCYQGFEVGSSADSVGLKTTRSVVQAIFLIIIADALFSIIYSMLGI